MSPAIRPRHTFFPQLACACLLAWVGAITHLAAAQLATNVPGNAPPTPALLGEVFTGPVSSNGLRCAVRSYRVRDQCELITYIIPTQRLTNAGAYAYAPLEAAYELALFGPDRRPVEKLKRAAVSWRFPTSDIPLDQVPRARAKNVYRQFSLNRTDTVQTPGVINPLKEFKILRPGRRLLQLQMRFFKFKDSHTLSPIELPAVIVPIEVTSADLPNP